jgi:hypothetical protein
MSNPGNLSVDSRLAIDPQHPVYYFDLAPVLSRSSALQHNPDRIQRMCEQCVRRVAPRELMLFKDSGFFLVIQSSGHVGAEAVAGAVNVALVELFFGTESYSGLAAMFRLAQHGELGATGIAPGAPARAPSQTENVLADPLARLAESGVPGYEGLQAGFLPMINLRRDAASIYLCGPVRQRGSETVFGSAALADANPQDRASIDHAMLEYSIGFARAVVPTKFAAAIGTSVSYETLAWARGRRIYQEALRAANVAENPFLIVKIENVPAGATVQRLAEVVSVVKPYVKRVFLELPDCETGLTFAGQIGASGLISSLSANATPAEAGRIAARLVRTAMAQQALSCIDGVTGAEALARVRAAGVRFAAGRISEDGLDSLPFGGRRAA